MNKIRISVIIPTYNPDQARLNQTLTALKKQTLPAQDWEIILVDNNSNNDALLHLETLWHPNFRIVKETKQGLTYARIKGFKQANGDFIVMVDDDNLLDNHYLATVLSFFEKNIQVGSIGGKSIALFENLVPEKWKKDFLKMLAVRDLGDDLLISDTTLTVYPTFAPIGAGMGLKKEALKAYIDDIENNENITTDRVGNSLASGGDNEINIFMLKQGYAVAYLSQLTLQHIIPSTRLSKYYLARLNSDSSESWVKLLHKHGLSPWRPIHPFTLRLRLIKAFIKHRPWRSEAHYIHYKGSCGILKGLAQNYVNSYKK